MFSQRSTISRPKLVTGTVKAAAVDAGMSAEVAGQHAAAVAARFAVLVLAGAPAARRGRGRIRRAGHVAGAANQGRREQNGQREGAH